MEEQQKNIGIETEQQAKFFELLKDGIYKSLCAEGIINQNILMQLLENKEGEAKWNG